VVRLKGAGHPDLVDAKPLRGFQQLSRWLAVLLHRKCTFKLAQRKHGQ